MSPALLVLRHTVAIAASLSLVACATTLPPSSLVASLTLQSTSTHAATSTAMTAMTALVAPPTSAGASATLTTVSLQFPSQVLPGQVLLNGKPLAGARLSVLDAVTNQPVALAAAVTTDAQGRFSLHLPEFGPGTVVRVVATKDGQTLSTLVSRLAATAAKGFHVQGLASPLFSFGGTTQNGATSLTPLDWYQTGRPLSSGTGTPVFRLIT